MSLAHYIFISVEALTQKLNPSALSATISSLGLQPWPLINKHTIVSSSEPKQPPLPEMNPYKVRVVLSKPTHAARTEFSPPSANHSPFEAKHSSRFVHSTLRVTPLTSPCPTLSADA